MMARTAVEQASRFEELYRTHGPRLLRNVLLYSGDREIANDAVAEAFAQAMRRGEAVRDPLAWVTRASFRIAAGALKERHRLPARRAALRDARAGGRARRGLRAAFAEATRRGDP